MFSLTVKVGTHIYLNLSFTEILVPLYSLSNRKKTAELSGSYSPMAETCIFCESVTTVLGNARSTSTLVLPEMMVGKLKCMGDPSA